MPEQTNKQIIIQIEGCSDNLTELRKALEDLLSNELKPSDRPLQIDYDWETKEAAINFQIYLEEIPES